MNSNEIVKENKCLLCNRKLITINKGKNHYHSDWNTRKYHKSCYKKKCEDENYNNFINNLHLMY